jgi:hypothetical protein
VPLGLIPWSTPRPIDRGAHESSLPADGVLGEARNPFASRRVWRGGEVDVSTSAQPVSVDLPKAQVIIGASRNQSFDEVD